MKQWHAVVALVSVLLVVTILAVTSERQSLDFILRRSSESETVSHSTGCVRLLCVLHRFS